MEEYFRRAKSEWASKFLPGHWALDLQKFPLVRFHDCAWLCRANGTGAEYAVGATLAVARKPSPGGRTIPPIRGKCPKGTKGVGGPKGPDEDAFSASANFQTAKFFPHTPAAARKAPGTPFSGPPAVLSSGHRRSGRRSPGCGAPLSPRRSSGTPAPAGRG